MAAAANSTSVIMEVCYFEIVIFSLLGYNNLIPRGSRKFCRSGSNFDYVFYIMRGGRIQVPL